MSTGRLLGIIAGVLTARLLIWLLKTLLLAH